MRRSMSRKRTPSYAKRATDGTISGAPYFLEEIIEPCSDEVTLVWGPRCHLSGCDMYRLVSRVRVLALQTSFDPGIRLSAV
jgi:hypothetical protein